ncbi:serine hydrolase [Emticicia sp. 21SJ11W-3]|uniref:serine hydrolase domain-containing protein n=1 Tax=Emticicia sp. 21SJ11W-3 TaxID=2916755 RepID=UPI0020A0A722|nr:serine hydrolase domain-containing protein [Emticicia sp. 21SJ11W-3]UTA67529.1 beta-lactamase family protein [Emticicia sp. 21SJ11W-3]
MKIKRLLPFFVSVAIASIQLQAQEVSQASIKKALDSIALQDVVPGGPGIATGIVKNGKIIYIKYAGYANLADSLLISPQSRFNIASNGKQFTALAIYILAKEQRLNLKDDIRKYLPEIFKDAGFKISIENLLNHSSGIRDVYDLWSLKGITWWKQTFSNTDALDLIKNQKELNFAPGTQYLYSNSNYILLAEIIRRVTQTSFRKYTDTLFQKLKMPNTGFNDDYKNIQGPVAKPYFNFNTWTGYDWTCDIVGDGNLFTTLEDQLQWEKIIQEKQTGYIAADLISKSQKPLEGSAIRNYGLGLEFGKYKNFDYSFHEGTTGAWKATTLRFPQENLSIVTLTNSGKAIPAMQSRQMADILLGIDPGHQSYLTKPANTGKYLTQDEVLGAYQTDNHFTFRFEMRDTSLFLLRAGRNDTRLLRESANVFHQWNDPAFKLEFKPNAQNEMEVTAYYTTHAPYSLKRVNANWGGYNYEKLNGIFYNAETGVTLTLKHQKDKTYNLSFGKNNRSGFLVSTTKLSADNYSLEFAQNAQKTVEELFIDSDRLRKVRFVRVR